MSSQQSLVRRKVIRSRVGSEVFLWAGDAVGPFGGQSQSETQMNGSRQAPTWLNPEEGLRTDGSIDPRTTDRVILVRLSLRAGDGIEGRWSG
jgi:hypothetical protein